MIHPNRLVIPALAIVCASTGCMSEVIDDPSGEIAPDGLEESAERDVSTTSLALAASSVTRHEFTWKFDRSYTVGQYAGGDYWVVGPVRIIGITPASTVSGGRVMHGSMINPAAGPTTQGYDSSMYGSTSSFKA